VNEGYNPAVASDVLGVLGELVPRDAGYSHLEGNSDSQGTYVIERAFVEK